MKTDCVAKTWHLKKKKKKLIRLIRFIEHEWCSVRSIECISELLPRTTSFCKVTAWLPWQLSHFNPLYWYELEDGHFELCWLDLSSNKRHTCGSLASMCISAALILFRTWATFMFLFLLAFDAMSQSAKRFCSSRVAVSTYLYRKTLLFAIYWYIASIERA